jgi:hypothetical protein
MKAHTTGTPQLLEVERIELTRAVMMDSDSMGFQATSTAQCRAAWASVGRGDLELGESFDALNLTFKPYL